MSARRILFVAGAHTEIGKTHVACAVLRAARAAGWSTDVLKPVVSGFDGVAWAESDPGRLLAASGQVLSPAALETISPWRFAAPLAPPMAARLEGRPLAFAPVAGWCAERVGRSQADLMVVEGVGGLMSPIAERATSRDLFDALPTARAVLVGGGYLGAVSHLLTAFEVMCLRGRAPDAVVVSEDASPEAPDFAATVDLTAGFVADAPVMAAPRSGGDAWAAAVLRAAFSSGSP